MAGTNVRLLASKIEALDPEAQHAVEVAVDSLLRDVGPAPDGVVESRLAMLERRFDALGDQTRDDDAVVFLEDPDHCDLKSEIERLVVTAQRTLDELIRSDAVPRALDRN